MEEEGGQGREEKASDHSCVCGPQVQQGKTRIQVLQELPSRLLTCWGQHTNSSPQWGMKDSWTPAVLYRP